MENLDFVWAGIFSGSHEHFSVMTKLKSRNRCDNLELIYILKSYRPFQNMVESYHKRLSAFGWGDGWLAQFLYGTSLLSLSALTHVIGVHLSELPSTAWYLLLSFIGFLRGNFNFAEYYFFSTFSIFPFLLFLFASCL